MAQLRHCAKSLKVAGSIPDGLKENFRRHYSSSRSMVVRLTQPQTEMSTRNIFLGGGVKATGA